jgi:hypothetical protein
MSLSTQAASCVTHPCSSCCRWLGHGHRGPGLGLLLLLLLLGALGRQTLQGQEAAAATHVAAAGSSSTANQARCRPQQPSSSSTSSSTRMRLYPAPWWHPRWTRSSLLMTGARHRQPSCTSRGARAASVAVVAARPRGPRVVPRAGVARPPKQQLQQQQLEVVLGTPAQCLCAHCMVSLYVLAPQARPPTLGVCSTSATDLQRRQRPA